MKERTVNPDIGSLLKIYFRNEGEIKTSCKGKVRESVANRTSLKELLWSSHNKERNPAICDNMDGPWGHYVEWNKSDRERQVII